MASYGWRCMESWLYSGHLLFWGGGGGGGRGRGCEELVCHLDFATTEVPDLRQVLRGPVKFEELSREH